MSMNSPQILNESLPKILWFPQIISAEEAQHIIALAKPLLEPAGVMAYGGNETSNGRTNSVCWLEKAHDELVNRVCERIANLVDMPLSHAEKIQVVYYTQGQEFKPHFDAIRPVSIHAQQSLQALGGQRLLTALVYLNEVTAGGETYFPKLDIAQPPTAFSMLVFTNTNAAGNLPDPLSQHGAAPVLAGEKWAFNLWFRQNPTGY
jgi:prolyl 4-hydroxylase